MKHIANIAYGLALIPALLFGILWDALQLVCKLVIGIGLFMYGVLTIQRWDK